MDFYKLQPPYEMYSITKSGIVKNNISNHVMREWTNKYGYLYYTLRNSELKTKRNLSKHRLIAKTFIENPKNLPCIDHIDRNKKNNEIDNLRWSNYQMNAINRDSNNPLGRGVTRSRNKKRYNVNLWRNNKKKWIGVYDTVEEARKAYKTAVENWYLETTKTTPDLEEI